MRFRIDSADERTDGFRIDFIAIELESGNRECDTFSDISTNPDNLAVQIIDIRHKGCGCFPDNSNSRERLRRRNPYPSVGFEHYSVFRYESG